jgi:hypothetical protein
MLLLLVPALLATGQPVPRGEMSDRLVELPPFIVAGKIELPPPESWRYARIDGFEVLSSTSDQEANRLLRDFQMFRRALAIVRPAPAPRLASSTLILCGRANGFNDFTTDGRDAPEGDIARLLLDHEQSAMVLNLAARTVGDTVPPTYLEPERHLYREYVRLLVSQGGVPTPPWLFEGTAQMVMDLEFRDRTIRFGRIDQRSGAPVDVSPASDDVVGTSNGVTADQMVGSRANPGADLPLDVSAMMGVRFYRPFQIALLDRALLPMDRFFAVTAKDPEAADAFFDPTWAKQAYAFVHMCQFRRDARFKAPFADFVRRLAQEPPSEQLFQECFGLSYQEMLDELRQYIRYPRHVFRDIKLTEEGRLTAEEVQFREATQGEIARIKGDAQRLVGRHKDALLACRVAYARGERDSALLATLGVAEHDAGESGRAKQFLEAATRLGTDRPSAWVTVARLRLEEAKATPAEAGKLSAAQMAAVLTPLLKARALQPVVPEVYSVMAETWMCSAAAPTPANIHVIGEGVMRFPFDSTLALKTAQLYARAGDVRDAAEVARMGLRFAADAATRARFNEFLGTLPTLPPSGPPPADESSGNPTS